MYYVGVFMFWILKWVCVECKGCYDYLYGFYLGEIIEIFYGIEDKLEFIYVVVVVEDVVCIGKCFSEIDFLCMWVKVKGFRCSGIELIDFSGEVEL